MRKPNLIIGKKQIILACLTLILGVAVYVNFLISKGNDIPSLEANAGVNSDADMANANAGDDDTVDVQENAGNENFGDAKFVDNNADDYFVQARLDKLKSRDTAVETLQAIIGGGDITEDEMVVKALEAVELSKLGESESEIETLVKAQGFNDCVVYLDGANAKVVVKTEGLEKAQAASIKDIILSKVTVPTENIRIFEVK